MEIKFVDLNRQYLSLKGDIDKVISKVIDSSCFIGGEFVKDFEKSFANYLGISECIGVGSGTDAIYISLVSLGIGLGDEVITVANSFIATSEAITRTGAKVKFIDCNRNNYNIDIESIEKSINEKTKAIVVVHLYGQPVNMDKILQIADKYNIFIVEDAAQAHGALYKGKKAGTFGDCGAFSFFPGKNLGAYGDAGAIVTNNLEVAKKARMYANHGRISKHEHEFEGINSRLDSLQAAILNVKLRHLDEWIGKRQNIANIYDKFLKGVVKTPCVDFGIRHAYHLYVIQTENRDAMREYLAGKGISTGIHYPSPLPLLKAYRYMGCSERDFPNAFFLKDRLLSLPVYPEMTEEEVIYIVKSIKEFGRKSIF